MYVTIFHGYLAPQNILTVEYFPNYGNENYIHGHGISEEAHHEKPT